MLIWDLVGVRVSEMHYRLYLLSKFAHVSPVQNAPEGLRSLVLLQLLGQFAEESQFGVKIMDAIP